MSGSAHAAAASERRLEIAVLTATPKTQKLDELIERRSVLLLIAVGSASFTVIIVLVAAVLALST